MEQNRQRLRKILNRELLMTQSQEQKLRQAALKKKPALWKTALEKHIPDNVYSSLESVFCKGFGIVFAQGRIVIEAGYNKRDLQEEYAVRDFAVHLTGGRKEMKHLHKGASTSNQRNLAVTTLEGIGFGALGVGMPDIVTFLATLLKGVYETALSYGFDYASRQEQMFILKMLQTALTSGSEWDRRNAAVNQMMLAETSEPAEAAFQQQLQETAAAFAMDMLVMKFIQGMPVVGILGGAANPVYYSKIMKYVQLMYQKRYLLKQKRTLSGASER